MSIPSRRNTTYRRLSVLKPKVLSLYTGLGGLDFGLEAAGFETAVAVEMNPIACRVLRANRSWPILEGEIDGFSSQEILEAAKVKPGEIELLAGGPPCQPFSKSSYWVTGDALRLDDPRADTLTSYLRVLRDAKPKAFILENVQGLSFKNKSEGLHLLLDGIKKINKTSKTNYKPVWATLNAADYGVPQIRQRVFLIGSRDGKIFNFPPPSHRNPEESSALSNSWHTTWDVLHDLPIEPEEKGLVVGGRWGNLLPSIPEGKNYLWHTDRSGGIPLFGWRTRYWSFLLKISKKMPSWTIQAQPGTAIGPFHWDNRRLTVRELCRIQTIPDDVILDCGRTDSQKLIGNAVPSLIGEVLGANIRNQLLGHNISVSKFTLLPERQASYPPEQQIFPPAKEYKALVGTFSAHPGTGKGKSALKRYVET